MNPLKLNVWSGVHEVKPAEFIPAIFLAIPILISMVILPTGLARYIFGIPLELAFQLSWPFTVIFSYFSWKTIPKTLTHQPSASVAFLVGFMSLAILSFFQLYNPVFNGLVTVGGGDAGNHIYLQREFELRDPRAYKGFISLYTFNIFIKNIFNLDDFRAFRVSFYTLVFALCMFPPFIWSYYLKNYTNRSIVLFLAIAIPLAWVLYTLVINPLLHYNQADGFYPHIFSILVLFMLWIFQILAPNMFLRFIFSIIFLVLYRFSYGLNLADLFLFLSFASISELIFCKNLNSPMRYLHILFTVTCILCAIYAVTSIIPIIETPGALVSPKLHIILPTLLLSVIAIILLAKGAFSSHSASKLTNELWFRVAGLPVVMSISAVVFIAGVTLFGFKIDYYSFKYLLHSQVLSILALVSIIPCRIASILISQEKPERNILIKVSQCLSTCSKDQFFLFIFSLTGLLTVFASFGFVVRVEMNHELAFKLLQRFISISLILISIYALIQILKKRLKSGILIVVTAAAVCGHILTTSVYLHSFANRVSIKGPWQGIASLTDPEADRKIADVLSENEAKFGGYIVSSWPLSNFMNATHDFFGQWYFWTTGNVQLKGGYCAFWADALHHENIYTSINKDKGSPVKSVVNQLRSRPEKECFEYYPKFTFSVSERLCWVCPN